MKKLFIIAQIIVFSAQSFALATPNFFYDSSINSVEQYILSRSCYSLTSSKYSTSCSPSHNTSPNQKRLHLNILATDSISEVLEYSEHLQNEDGVAAVEQALNSNEVIMSSAALAIDYSADYWGLFFVPTRMHLATKVENPALPEIAMHASVEKELGARLFLKSKAIGGLSYGVTLRGTETTFIRENFDFLSAAIDSDSIEVQKGFVVQAEPSAAYRIATKWSPTLTATVSNLKILESGDKIPTNTVTDVGISVTPNFLNERLEATIHYTGRDDIQYWKRNYSFGARYIVTETLNLLFSYSSVDIAIGLQGNIDSLLFGVGYKSINYNFSEFNLETVDSVVLSLGLGF
jgi:hypothetical protein